MLVGRKLDRVDSRCAKHADERRFAESAIECGFLAKPPNNMS